MPRELAPITVPLSCLGARATRASGDVTTDVSYCTVRCRYETSSSSGASSSGASPRHEAEYFSPSSPPDHFLAHGKSEWIDHDHDVPNGSAVHPELADLNHVLFGQEGGDSGCEQDSKFYVAQQMLPRMQNRLWSAEEQADITMYADSLRRAVEDVTCEDDFMDLAEGDAGEAGLPWATYMSTQVCCHCLLCVCVSACLLRLLSR